MEQTVNNKNIFAAAETLSNQLDEFTLSDMEKIIVVETLSSYVRNVFTAKVTACAVQKSLQ